MPKNASSTDSIREFRSDLNTMSLRDVVRKHISTGQPRQFTSQDYFELRRMIATEFDIHPNSVVVVGSTRTGFSLNPKHRYRQVRSDSDIDIAIVSPELFDTFWDRVFDYWQEDLAWRQQDSDRFRNSLFKGWIDPRYLPNTPGFEATQQWVKFFDGLMQSRRFGRRTITARLYRTWGRLEAYQEQSVLACTLSERSSR